MASHFARRATAVAAMAAAVGMLAPLATANGDTRIPLAGKSKTQAIGSGGSITVTSKGESALLSPGMVSLPTTRNAWVSGSISAKVSGEADGGTIEAGYVVGCQIDVGTAGIQLSGTADSGVGFSSTTGGNPLSVTPSISGKTGGSISLAAGTVGTQALTYTRAKWPEPGDDIAPDWFAPDTDYSFDGASGSLNYTDQTIGVDGCAGYAQARLYAIVTAQVGNSEGTVILWGDKFTLG